MKPKLENLLLTQKLEREKKMAQGEGNSKREGVIYSRMEHINKALEALQSALESLKISIEAILLPSESQVESPKSPRAVGAPFADSLSDILDKVDNIADFVGQIRRRVDL